MNANGDSFKVDFPVWVPSLATNSVGGILPVKANETGGFVLLMFSTREKTRAFLDASSIPSEYVARPIDDGLALFGLLVLMEKKGVTHVSLDPVNANEVSAQPVAKIRAWLEKRFD